MWFSFLFCASIELYASKFTTQVKSNILVCIIFQLYYIIHTIILVLNGNGNVTDCKDNLNLLYGYFFYDTVNLFLHLNDAEFMYIFHHGLSLYIIDYAIKLNLTTNNAMYISMIALISECQNPILNLKVFIQEYPELKRLNKMILYYMYFVFRIILFPIYSCLFLYTMKFDYIFTSFFLCIYTMSFNWFLTMHRKFQFKVKKFI